MTFPYDTRLPPDLAALKLDQPRRGPLSDPQRVGSGLDEAESRHRAGSRPRHWPGECHPILIASRPFDYRSFREGCRGDKAPVGSAGDCTGAFDPAEHVS